MYARNVFPLRTSPSHKSWIHHCSASIMPCIQIPAALLFSEVGEGVGEEEVVGEGEGVTEVTLSLGGLHTPVVNSDILKQPRNIELA